MQESVGDRSIQIVSGAVEHRVLAYRDGVSVAQQDFLAHEAPLSIGLISQSESVFSASPPTLTITLRTRGHDEELTAGLLVAEGYLAQRDEWLEVRRSGPDEIAAVLRHPLPRGRGIRQLAASSSCGACGKTDVADLLPQRLLEVVESNPVVGPDIILNTSAKLRSSQPGFEVTAGMHAAAFCSESGEIQVVREDVGRHNALDKLIGRLFLDEKLQSPGWVLLSGRIGFELVQKAHMAGIVLLAAVGAPSSLAVELGERLGITLVGFVRGNRLNVYCHEHRVFRGDKT